MPLESKAKKRCFSAAATSSDADSSDTSDVSVSICDSHCKCVSSLTERIHELEKELELESEKHRETCRQLEKCRKERQTTEEKLCREQDKREFCLERFAGNDAKIRYYTGFFSIGLFLACFGFLEKSAGA